MCTVQLIRFHGKRYRACTLDYCAWGWASVCARVTMRASTCMRLTAYAQACGNGAGMVRACGGKDWARTVSPRLFYILDPCDLPT